MLVIKDGCETFSRISNSGKSQLIAVIDLNEVAAIELDLCDDPKLWEAQVHLKGGQTINLKGEQVRLYAEAAEWEPLSESSKTKGENDE